jgi:hypothetical protein
MDTTHSYCTTIHYTQVYPAEDGIGTASQRQLLRSYNELPFLTKPQHSFWRVQHLPAEKGTKARSKKSAAQRTQLAGYLEIDVDMHNFSYLARQGLHSLLSRLPLMRLEIAFLLEAKSAADMPEQVLGSFELRDLDLQTLAAEGPDDPL